MRCVEISKRATTIGELLQLPNSFSQVLFRKWRQREEYFILHPKDAEAQAQSDAIRDGLMGG